MYFSRCFLSLQESDFQSLFCLLRNPEEPLVLSEDIYKAIYHSVMMEHKEDTMLFTIYYFLCASYHSKS